MVGLGQQALEGDGHRDGNGTVHGCFTFQRMAKTGQGFTSITMYWRNVRYDMHSQVRMELNASNFRREILKKHVSKKNLQ